MNRDNLAIFYQWGAKILLFAIPFLFILIDKNTFFPYVAPRGLLFRFLIEIAFVLAVGFFFLKKEKNFKFSSISGAILVFLVIIGLADLLGVNPFRSFWSRFERMDGYLNLIHLTMFFFAIRFTFNSKKNWFSFFNIILGISIIEFFYALLQKMGKIESIIGGFRAEGTFGNPTYLAAFALFCLGIALMLFLNSEEKWKKGMFFGLVFLNFMTIYMTATRGVFVGIFAGWIVFTFFSLFIKGENRKLKLIKKYSLIGLLNIFLVFGALWFFRSSDFVSSNETLNRITSISLTDGTTQGRFLVWNLAFEGVKEKPILGWGQENFIDVFNKYYEPELYNQESWFDRAHNVVMDWLVAGGLLGLISYLLIFIFSGKKIFSFIKKEENKEEKIEGLMILAILASYFVQNLFVFDNLTTYVMFFSLIAYIDSLGNFESEKNKEEVEEKNKNLILTIFSVLLVIVLAISWFINVKPYLQARKVISTIKLMYQKSTVGGEVLGGFEEALNYNTFGNGEVKEQMGKIVNDILASSKANSIPEKDRRDFVEKTIEEMKKEVEKNPKDLRVKLFLGTIYTRFSDLNENYLDLGEEQITEALKISPKKQQTYFSLVENYIRRGDYKKALAIAKEAYDLENNYVVARGNLAYVAVLNNDEKLIEKMINEGLTAQYLARVGDGYIALKNFSQALEVMKLAVLAGDGVAEYRAKLAGLYLNQGQIKEAVEQAKIAKELDPVNYKESVDMFLDNIRKMGYKID